MSKSQQRTQWFTLQPNKPGVVLRYIPGLHPGLLCRTLHYLISLQMLYYAFSRLNVGSISFRGGRPLRLNPGCTNDAPTPVSCWFNQQRHWSYPGFSSCWSKVCLEFGWVIAPVLDAEFVIKIIYLCGNLWVCVDNNFSPIRTRWAWNPEEVTRSRLWGWTVRLRMNQGTCIQLVWVCIEDDVRVHSEFGPAFLRKITSLVKCACWQPTHMSGW